MLAALARLSPVRLALLVGLLALAVRAAAILIVFEDRTYFSDEVGYLQRAQAVVDGNLLGTDTIAPPGPVYFLAACKALGLGSTGIRLVQTFLGAAAACLTVLLGVRLFGTAVGILAGVGAAVYPYLIYISGIFYTQNAVIPLALLVLLGLYRRQDGGGVRWLVTAGAALGVAGQFMVPFLLTSPFLGIWHALRMPGPRRGMVDLALLAIVSLATLIPVTARNYALEDRFIFISSMGGRAFYWANNPDIDPRERDPERWIEINVTRVQEEQAERGWTEAQMDSALSARAVDFVRKHPGRFARNVAIRIGTMWSFTPKPFTKNEHTGGKQRLLAAVSSAPVLILAPLGWILFRRRWRELFPLVALPIVLTLAFAMFHTTVRYRLTVEPLLILAAAAALVRLIRPSAVRPT